MPLRLLLDEHLSPRVVEGVRSRRADIVIESIQVWQAGLMLGATDDALLRAAFTDRRTLVTYDQRTIIPLLVDWAEQDISHAGVILVDDRTIPSHDVGGLVVALVRLAEERGTDDWTDRVIYLARGSE